MAPTRPGPAGSRRHVDFIQQFTERESQQRITKQRKPLTATQRAALRKQLRTVRFLQPDHVDNTKINIASILRKWKG